MNRLKDFFAPVAGSVKGLVNFEELWKSTATATAGGALIGLLIATLSSISAHASTIFPNPTVAALATSFLGLVIDLLRRQADGQPATILPPGSTVPPAGAISPPPPAVAAKVAPTPGPNGR